MAKRALIAQASGGAEILDGFSPFEPEKMTPVLADCDVILTFRIPKDVATRAPRLKWIHLMSAGHGNAFALMQTHRVVWLANAAAMAINGGVELPLLKPAVEIRR